MENDVINFAEGLIGLPEMKRAILIPLPEYEPFCWLASVDDEKNRFIVINPFHVFPDYDPVIANGADGQYEAVKDLNVWSIAKISSDWHKTTINLRAPIFVNPQTKKGAQIVLTESSYSLTESFPQL